jgi:hypothetical protein
VAEDGCVREWSDEEVRSLIPTFSKKLTVLITNIDCLKKNIFSV